MTEVHRYKIVTVLSKDGNRISYAPHGPDAVMAHEYDKLKAENERLQRFETAYKEFSDKTDWVRPNASTQELGMHVADILRKRCDDLTSHNQAQADEIKALRKVSARYEWLKKNTTVMLKKTISYVTALGLINTCYPSSLELDDAIDNAMAQEQQP